MRYLAFLPVLALAACGGSSGGGDPRPTTAELDAVREMSVISADEMPVTGSAEFAGVVEFGVRRGDGDVPDESGMVTSDIDLSVDFAEGDLTGTASNFHSEEVGAVNGVATISEGWVDGAEFGGDLTGDVSGVADGEAYTGSVDLNLRGEFVADTPADGPDGVVGDVYGTVTVDGDGTDFVGGDFVAVRQD